MIGHLGYCMLKKIWCYVKPSSVYRRAMVRPPPPLGLTVNFWIIFTVFVSFVISRLNCKIRVPRLPCFLPVKNCSKRRLNLSFWEQKLIYFWGGTTLQPLHHTPLRRRQRRIAPLLTEILNTPLVQPFRYNGWAWQTDGWTDRILISIWRISTALLTRQNK